MSIIKTEAVILKCDNYRETSKIVCFYSKSHGKLRGIAKGVRSSKTRWGGALQSMAYLNMMFYFNENRTLHLISGGEYVKQFQSTYDDYDKLQVGFRIIELVNKTTEEHQENADLFNLLVESLDALNIATKNYVNVLFNLEFRLAKLLGFGIDFKDILSKNIDKIKGNQYFYKTKFSQGDIKVLNLISEGNFNSLAGLSISKSQQIVLDMFFENYFKSHFEDINLSNTKRVFDAKEIFIA
jgi:DNA repair protein RecO